MASLEVHAIASFSCLDMSQRRTLFKRQCMARCLLRLPYWSFGISPCFSACFIVNQLSLLLFILYAATISLIVRICSMSVTPAFLKSSKSSIISHCRGENPISKGTVTMRQSTASTFGLYVAAMWCEKFKLVDSLDDLELQCLQLSLSSSSVHPKSAGQSKLADVVLHL